MPSSDSDYQASLTNFSTTCFHCGLDFPENISITAEFEGDLKSFCCHGCRAVFGLITAGGLQNYYQYRTNFSKKADPRDESFEEFDNDNFQKSFCEPNEDDSKTAHLYIDGIHCAACTWLIEKSICKIPGIKSMNVSQVENAAQLVWDASQVKLSAVVKHIHQLGFNATPWSQDYSQVQTENAERTLLRQAGLAGIIMMQVGMFSVGLYASSKHGMDSEYKSLLHWFSILLTLPVLLYSAQPFFIGALRSLKQFTVNMDVPIALALGIAWIASVRSTITGTGAVYFDSLCMFVFLLCGVRYLELRARNKFTSIKNQGELPATCKLLKSLGDLNYEYINVNDVQAGHILYVQQGETVPVDGNLLSESAMLSEASISGEFLPIEKCNGDSILSGSVNQSAALFLEVERPASDSCLQSIQRLALKAREKRPAFLHFSDKVARYFSLAVLLVTFAAGFTWQLIDPQRVLEIVIAMLVVSCPCALSLAAPTAFTVAINYLRKQGVLVCNSAVLEKLNNIQHIIFDKTGTLTEGRFEVFATHYFSKYDCQKITALAKNLEMWSEHPIARAFENIPNFQSLLQFAVYDILIENSRGVSGKHNNETLRIGSEAFCRELLHTAVPALDSEEPSTRIWFASEKEWLACFELRDVLRKNAALSIKSLDIPTTILSGDSENVVKIVANALHINEYHAVCTPTTKLEYVDRMQKQEKKTVMMVGDGINDLPVLAQADVSVAMNSANRLAHIQADCILLNNNLSSLAMLFNKAKETYRVVRQNIVWAMLYNFSALPLAALGLIPPWAAALGMSCSSLFVVLNAARLSRPLNLAY